MAKSNIRSDKNPFEPLSMVAAPMMKVGGRFIFDGIEFEYVGPLTSGLHQFINPTTGEALSPGGAIRAVTSEWLTDMIACRRLVFAFEPLRSDLPMPEWSIDEILQKDPVALLRQKILVALDDAVERGGRCTATVRRITIAKVCYEHPNLMAAYRGMPNDRQVLVWYNTYGQPGRRSLRACVSLRGRVLRAPKLEERQISAIREAILLYCNSQEADYESAWHDFQRIVSEANAKIDREGHGSLINLCARSTFFVHFHREMQGSWLRKKLGERAYRGKFKGLGKGNEQFLPGEAYEIDHTLADIFLIDPDRDIVIGRPYITSIIDAGSRAIICLYVTFTPPSMGSVFEALKIAFSPKEGIYLADRHPALKGLYGIPKRVITDRGPEFTSNSFQVAIIDLGIALLFCRVRQPEDKPEVEKGFRTINDKIIHRLKGVAFHNVDKKLGDYDSEKHACLDLNTFSEILNKFISIYNLHSHDGLDGASPASVWQEHARYHPPRTFANWADIGRIAGVSRKRSLSRKGVRVEHLYYGTSQQITELLEVYRRARGGKAVHSVRVVSNSLDMGTIEVYCEPSKTYFTLMAKDYDYACGLSLYLHKKIRKSRGKTAEKLASQRSLDEELSNLRRAASSGRKGDTHAKKRDAARLLADIDAKESGAGDMTVVQPFSSERDDGTAPTPAAAHSKPKARRPKNTGEKSGPALPAESVASPLTAPALPTFGDFIR